MDGWENFFLGQVGASAALGGLLFVAASLNLERILSAAALPDRFLVALSLILAILVISSLMLIPDQPQVLVGFEALAVGAVLTGLVIRTSRNPAADEASGSRAKSTANAILSALAVLPYIAGGAFIVAGGLRTGLYLVAAAIILSFIKAVLDAWVLLVEINR